MKPFVVLTIYEVHTASASIMVDGVVVAAAHEERFSRIKSDVGFPLKAAKYCLKASGIDPKDIDLVGLSNLDFNKNGIANIMFKRQALYTIDDWIFENENYWKPKLINKKNIDCYFDIMGGNERVKNHYYDFSKINFSNKEELIKKKFNEIRIETVERLLKINKDKVIFLPHYYLHHYHAYYSSNFRDINNTVITHQEGDGGEYNCGVSIPTKNGLRWLGGTNRSDVGRLYQWVTLILGMKPYNHEYKLMGLAPFATDNEVKKTLSIFENLFKLDKSGIRIDYNQKPDDLYFHFLKQLTGHRFDGIAGALQLNTENILTKWIQSIVKKTNRKIICFGGGVAMNVKANSKLADLSEVENFFVPLSPSDETNVFGAGYLLTEKNMLKEKKDPNSIPSLDSVYLGPQFNIEIKDVNKLKKEGYFIYENISNKKIAKLLSKGKIFGRFVDRSEFGQRSLGNRSIIGCTHIPGIVDKINSQIKYRDFWMPFCPTILDVDAKKYLINKKNIDSRYMTMSFQTNPKYSEKIKGGMHIGDNTVRPQILKRKDNYKFYDLILEIKKITGIGAIINTSFNLHGEPVVGHPKDAIHTLKKSNLDGIIINDMLISRQEN